MAKNFVQAGKTLRFTAPSGGVVNGRCHLIGTLPVIAEFTAAEGEPFEGTTEGVYELPKTSGDVYAEGVKVYLIAATGVTTTTASGNTLIGAASEAAASGTTLAKVRLNGTTV